MYFSACGRVGRRRLPTPEEEAHERCSDEPEDAHREVVAEEIGECPGHDGGA